MSQSAGRDGLPSRTRQTASSPYVSPTASSNTSLRNNPPPPGQAVLSSTLIPRDYLASISKPRLNVADASIPQPQPPSSTPSSSAVSSQAAARALSQDHSSDESSDDEDIVLGKSDVSPQDSDLKVAKTRTNVSTANQTRLLQKSSAPPESPRSITSSITTDPPPQPTMPRTSSIDSAISTISNSSHPQKSSSEHRETTATDIRNLIATAGSAENLIQHLLRDKAHAASQNAQLWKLVDKQRALLLGLNKDLERVTKERDRYRKKAKELQALPLSENVTHHAAESQTPPTSAGEEPRSQLVDGSNMAAQTNGISTAPAQERHQANTGGSAVEEAMMPSPLHFNQHHSQPVSEDPPGVAVYPPPQNTERNLNQQPPKLAALTTELAPPAFSVTEATPLVDSPARAFPAPRKAPPKPLDLKQTNQEQRQSKLTESHTAPQDSEAEPHERGRRKTREEDDRDRELAVLQEQEARSRSKKEKHSKLDQSKGDPQPTSPKDLVQKVQQPEAQPPSHHQPSGNTHLVASPPAGSVLHRSASGTETRLLSAPLRSPGLPASPRPADRPLGSLPSLPMSPRNGGFPLSPRAPKQPLPMPTNIHSTDTLSHKLSESSSLPQTDSTREPDRLQVHDSTMSSSEIPPVYRGLVSPTWPDLLLPPNALPSIQVKVASSRLRPSRFSVLGFKPQEDSSVFSLSVFSRSNSGELWRLEKIPAALPHLEQQLRPRCPNLPRLPDRKLFTGHAPATLDTRRNAIDAYFEELLDTHVDEQSALIICRFLSTDVLEPPSDTKQRSGQSPQDQTQGELTGKIKKTGYLTKKGKNFGGWKSRYFVLDSPELRYFEAPGGAHLGTVKLYNAKIGRQTSTDGAHDDGDTDGQFRHAFLILEPKRKDSTSYVRHVLCAENDAERDDWVRTLLYYVEESSPHGSRPTTSGAPATEYSGMTGNPRTLLRGADYADGLADSTGKSSSPVPGHPNSGSDSPTSPSPATPEASNHEGYWSRSTNGPAATNTSGQQRGPPKQTQPIPQPHKEQKIRNLFQFRKSSHEQLSTSQSSDDRARTHEKQGHGYRGYVRPVFGLSLAEAVEVCPPQDVDVLLPAVVYRCIEYLRHQKAANEEGLFRLSGSSIVVRTLKERFDTEGDVDLVADEEYYDVHAVASLFKSYLRELPSTILTRDLHGEFHRVLELDDKQQKISAFNVLVHQLPRVNYTLLRALSNYLLEVVQNSNRNKMSVKNVGIVFAPTLNIPAPVFSMFLTEFEAIFSQHQGDENVITHTVPAPAGGEFQQEIRSPRHQMFSNLPTSPSFNQTSYSQNSSMQPNYAAEQSYQPESAADFGMSPMQSYESRNYVSIPTQLTPPQPKFPPPQPNQQNQQRGQYRMFAPEHAANDKAKRRESAMVLF